MDDTPKDIGTAKAIHVAHRDALAVYFANHPFEVVTWETLEALVGRNYQQRISDARLQLKMDIENVPRSAPDGKRVTGDYRYRLPGGKDANKQSLVPQFWRHMLSEQMAANAEDEMFQAIWIGYSLEQLQTLQSLQAFKTPIQFPICIPRQRIAFVENEAKREARISKLLLEGKTPNKKSQPSHANYISYIGPNSGAFVRVFSQFGQVRA